MQSKNESDRCYDDQCDYAMRPHYHVRTNNGTYIKYIVEKPKQKNYD